VRILLTHPHSWPYVRRGTERNIDNVARYLALRGHEVTLLSSLPSGGCLPAAGGCLPAAGSVRQMLRPPMWTPLLGWFRVQPEHMFGLSTYLDLRKLAADVVHSFFYTDSLAASRVRKQKRWRTVLQLNGIAIPGVSCRRFPPEAWLLRRAIEEADEFVVCSQFIARLAARHFGRVAKVIVPPLEIDAWPLGPGPEDGRPVLLAVGDFDVPRKGVRVLMRAFELFQQEVPDAILRLSGRLSAKTATRLLGTLPERVRTRVELLGLGQPGDLPQLYQQASLLVLPAMWEPSGTVMFEALASGTPVVATNHAGLPEFLSPEVGVLFEPETEGEETNNAAGLAAAMLAGLSLSRRPGAREQCRLHAGRFSSAAIGPLLEGVYAGN
jgi:glycosyltransferase involved in cell wall biosynthesis